MWVVLGRNPGWRVMLFSLIASFSEWVIRSRTVLSYYFFISWLFKCSIPCSATSLSHILWLVCLICAWLLCPFPDWFVPWLISPLICLFLIFLSHDSIVLLLIGSWTDLSPDCLIFNCFIHWFDWMIASFSE